MKTKEEQIAEAIMRETALNLGRAVVKQNQSRKDVRKFIRLSNYIKEIEGYERNKTSNDVEPNDVGSDLP